MPMQTNQLELDSIISEFDKQYDDPVKLYSRIQPCSSYHTTLPGGSLVHPTHDNLMYALILLRYRDEEFSERACEIIEKITDLQDCDSSSNTYGIWSWFLEETLEEMSPPDWNWAGFCGGCIVEVLHKYPHKLSSGLEQKLLKAAGHAAWSIFRRNMHVEYTNVAVAAMFVCASAGELLKEPRLVEYAVSYMNRILAAIDYHGGLCEYNSPNYSFVTLRECGRILYMVNNDQIRTGARKIADKVWEELYLHYHPGSRQLSGPQSRGHFTYLPEWILTQFPGQEKSVKNALPDKLEPLFSLKLWEQVPCPEELAEYFQKDDTAQEKVHLHKYMTLSEDFELPGITGTTWMAKDATLGTANYSDMWTQRRPLLGYWNTPHGIVTFRQRFLHDGYDFASAAVYNIQDHNRVLSGLRMISDRGDTHPLFDTPENTVFSGKEFVFRYEFSGPSLNAKMENNRITVSAGEWCYEIITTDGKFADNSIKWHYYRQSEVLIVECVCYQGEKKDFDFTGLKTVITFAQTLYHKNNYISAKSIIKSVDNEIAVSTWENMTLRIPISPGPCQMPL